VVTISLPTHREQHPAPARCGRRHYDRVS
jgi:hypothetical protein